MATYETVDNLTELVTKINEAKLQTKAADKQAGLFDLASSRAKRNNEIYAQLLPERIEVSPFVASFLAHDHQQHRERVRLLDENTDAGRQFLGLIANINLAIFNPTHLFGAAGNAISLIHISQQYDDLMKQRNQVAGPVLREYALIEESGRYFLKLAKFRAVQYSVAESLDREATGVASSVRIDALPTLPDSVKFSDERGR